MEGPDIVSMVIPLWLLLISAEFGYSQWQGKNWSRLNDTLNSLSMGSLSMISGVLSKVLALVTYLFVYEYALFSLADNSVWVWLLAFVLYDLCYYWNHRMGHDINILWAAHSAHHQSEDYNLSTALRQTSFTFVFSWVFYTPLAFLGVSPLLFLVAGGLNTIYQFWIHTRHIGKLGWLEKILVTPSSHRVHHGSNPVYMDKNYGGMFIVWDRLFGSYQTELDSDPVVYGISRPLRSWNPLWANLIGYVELFQDAWRAQRWQDKFTLWFRKTGWRPGDVEAQFPRAKRLDNYKNYDAKPNSIGSAYVALQFVLNTLMGLAYLALADDQSLIFNLLMVVFFVWQITAIGRLLEQKTQVLSVEITRLMGILLTVYIGHKLGLVASALLIAMAAAVVFSALAAVFIWRPILTPSLQTLEDNSLESL